jgi:hypothetical protein
MEKLFYHWELLKRNNFMKKFLVLFTICLPLLTFSQNKEEKFGISFSGFVKTDIFYDTRQTVNIREGHFLLYPDSTYMDANKKDMNAFF